MKILRTRMNYTQKQLGNRVGIHQTYISKIENGCVEGLTIGKLIKISKVLKITPVELLERLLSKNTK